ncbi:amidohydrolase family protein [Arthrobacter bambusae]|uniref:Cytosine/adenosine deaminase-related metal-dependent hydrolase n=1 Tax=Arthrobacter bambusae TaxID=1338426 RepID=A0AAW8DLA2_9MICC|nr:amidohydrolase family protein [Arthrobacter bambusae]MDP9907311.1 cytosine/adenosine deaminase-related metal-dependent hydrolase [Arthrobacter bambusae]MDQ0131448.1 cytosine/adenosine deaminase-related metal-dependent hydrolase [Arthrobacter bambusae]MDQ0182782.1 cytosine/adenosine deaminase-related metal-dependent hydrolase [Arthrobacter bambusae]
MNTLIRAVRPWGQALSDVLVTDGKITGVEPHDPARAAATGDTTVVEGRGRLLVPSFSDVHVHLDSTRIGLPFREHTGGPGVWTMMMNDRQNWRNAEVPLQERVNNTLGRMIARGTTRVRSYAQIDVDCRLERFDAVMAAKEQFKGQADVDIIAFPQAGLLLEDGTVPLMDQALKSGANVMGGIDPCSLDRDPARHLDIVFGLAEKYQVPIDIHLHEPGELGVFSTDLVIERTRALGMQGKVTMSHAYQLGSVSEATTRRLIDEFAELDISMASVAPGSTGVAAQLPIPLLAEAGVRMGLGEDGQRDYWSPYGNTDMLDRTWQLAFTHGFRKDELIEHCLAIATVGGASILDPSATRLKGTAHRPGVEVGDPAELLLLDGETVASAVMDRGTDRTVIHRGKVVADQLELV